MSLKDTIEGARREAEGNAVGRPKKEAEAIGTGEEEKKGFSRSSAAKARPAREAASSVRIESKPKSSGGFGGPSETKDEKRERKRRERVEEDVRNRAYDLVLRSIPGYKETEKVFWITLGAGLVLAVLSLAAAAAFGENTDVSTPQGFISVASLVLAYVCIIGGFIYDMVRRRPFRKRAEAQVRSLSDKKILELFEKDRKEREAKAAARAEKKAAKKK